jgi:hypothetical protein
VWRAVLLVSLVVPTLALGAGCGERFARRSTHGAIGAAAEHVEAAGGLKSVAQTAARKVATGALEELTAEERRVAFAELGHDVANAVAAGLHKELLVAIGPDGRGPLSLAMARSAEHLAQSAIFPECTGAERAACVHDQIAGIAEAAGTGLGRAIVRQLASAGIVVGFLLGSLFTVIVLLARSLVRERRGPVRTPHPST